MNLNLNDALGLSSEILTMITAEVRHDFPIVLCVPAIYIQVIQHLTKDYSNIFVGGQNLSQYNAGAYTGEIAGMMLKSCGTKYCIVGHSERRTYFNESSGELSQKLLRCFENDLVPIYCIGETEAEYTKNLTEEIIETQLKETLNKFSANQIAEICIAYEPVWAIGTGKTPSFEQIESVHEFIREIIKKLTNNEAAQQISILYGGSVNENNAAGIFNLPNVDGGLIGGAALKSRSFINIIQALT